MSGYDRVFNSIGSPFLAIRKFTGMTMSGEEERPGYDYYGGELDEPDRRPMAFIKDSVKHTFQQSGATDEWIRHITPAGSIHFPKLTWATAQILMQAFETEQLGNSKAYPAVQDNLILMKLYSDSDPYWLPVTLTGNLSFSGIADKIIVGHECEIQWQAVQPLDNITAFYTVGFAASGAVDSIDWTLMSDTTIGKTIRDWYYASISSEFLTW